MSYKNQYNTRNSGRYNQPGQFVSAGELVPGAGQRAPPAAAASTRSYQPQQMQQQMSQQFNSQRNSQPQQVHTNQNVTPNFKTIDIEMKPAKEESEPMAPNTADGSDAIGPVRPPYWMKAKLSGVTKKVSNKEKRRRQNENLRRLITPKNALMVLNEMLPNEQLANQFKVESAASTTAGGSQYYLSSNKQQHSFCADLTINGQSYKGYGENKLMARNVAAEQAIRDLIIQKMNKVLNTDNGAGVAAGAGAAAAAAAGEGEEDPLPMIQLASFALHKLFSEWEYEGHKVPQLKPSSTSVSLSETGSESGALGALGALGAMAAAPKSAKPPKPAKELPANAADMHPCMLLTYMRPQLEYRELAVDGDRPQNLVFTLGVTVDGETYIGKASNKKEARKQAAKAACLALFGVRFSDKPCSTTPKPVSAAAAAASASG